MRARRWAFVLLVAAVATGLLVLGWRVLAAGGWSAWEGLLFACLAANAPWLALSAATGLAGIAVRVLAADPVAAVLPTACAPGGGVLRTALAACVRDEDMGAVLAPLERLLRGLAAAGEGARFVAWVLSDTADPARAAAEARAVAALAARHPEGRVRYRRRPANVGFKAGNVMDFLDHHADGLDLMLALDADSAMTAPAVLRLVAAMEADPRLAILQATIAARPARALFPRLFGFGHRPGSRVWATGQAWWQGDRGPFWGHNALVRIAPFRTHCRLGPLPDGSAILSHDHVEAARLHAAGWGVRVMPDDRGSRDAQPPTLPEFLARDSRWAAGNMQYRHLLRRPELGRLGRFQMLQAILHYALTPFWFAMLPLAALNAVTGGGAGTPRGALLGLLAAGWLALHLPKLLGYAELLARPRLGAPRGGRVATLRAIGAELLFTQGFDPLIAFHKTRGVLAFALRGAGILPARGPSWAPQRRADHAVAWADAARLLWPHTLCGLLLLAAFAATSGFALLASLPFVAGLVLAIPFCVLTARPTPGARSRPRAVAGRAAAGSAAGG